MPQDYTVRLEKRVALQAMCLRIYIFTVNFTSKYIKIIFFIFKKSFLTLIYNQKAFETQMTGHNLHQACFNELAEILQASGFLLYRKAIHVRVRAFMKL